VTRLELKTDFHSFEMQEAVFPVEVRKPNYALVQIGLAPGSVSVLPGTYTLVARMPGGQELRQEVTVVEGQPFQEVTLSPVPGEESTNESLEQVLFMAGQARFALMRGSDEHGPPLKMAWYCWNSNERAYAPTAPTLNGSPRGVVFVSSDVGPLLLGVTQPDGSQSYSVLPIAPHGFCKVVIDSQGDEGWRVEPHPNSPTADGVVRGLSAGRFADAGAVAVAAPLYGVSRAPGDVRDLEALLKEKLNDPVAAAVGAYALLRLNELERLRDWTKNLQDWFEWLPDGSAIYGEHLARQGRHEEAAAAFLQVPARGLPVFTEGLGFALTRLRFYAALPPDEFPEDMGAKARAAATHLGRAAGRLDFARAFTTFTGPSPNILSEG
jgi:hypothetical protein